MDRAGQRRKPSFLGVRNRGIFAPHELRDGVPQRVDWADTCDRGRTQRTYGEVRIDLTLPRDVTRHPAVAYSPASARAGWRLLCASVTQQSMWIKLLQIRVFL